jgi:LemA protein
MGFLIFLAVIIAVAVIVAINAYNRLARLRNQYKNAFSQVDVQLQRRHDLVPSLLATVKSHLKQDPDTFEVVLKALSSAIDSSRQAALAPADPQGMHDLARDQVTLSHALERLFGLIESHPDLLADLDIGQLMEEIRFTDNHIALACQAFNDAVDRYNSYRKGFPNSWVANSFGFQRAETLAEPVPANPSITRVSSIE